MKVIKVVAFGDCVVGKTSLLVKYSFKLFSNEYIPTVFENYSTNTIYEGEEFEISYSDTSGGKDYRRLRFLSYTQTNVIVLCYSISDKETYHHIDRYWKEELNQYVKDVPIILVATKSDLGKELEYDDYWHYRFREVSMKEGIEMALKIKASYFIEVSAKTGENVDDLFEKAFHIGLKDELLHLRNNKKENCVIC